MVIVSVKVESFSCKVSNFWSTGTGRNMHLSLLYIKQKERAIYLEFYTRMYVSHLELCQDKVLVTLIPFEEVYSKYKIQRYVNVNTDYLLSHGLGDHHVIRQDNQEYQFTEAHYVNLHPQDLEDML